MGHVQRADWNDDPYGLHGPDFDPYGDRYESDGARPTVEHAPAPEFVSTRRVAMTPPEPVLTQEEEDVELLQAVGLAVAMAASKAQANLEGAK